MKKLTPVPDVRLRRSGRLLWGKIVKKIMEDAGLAKNYGQVQAVRG